MATIKVNGCVNYNACSIFSATILNLYAKHVGVPLLTGQYGQFILALMRCAPATCRYCPQLGFGPMATTPSRLSIVARALRQAVPRRWTQWPSYWARLLSRTWNAYSKSSLAAPRGATYDPIVLFFWISNLDAFLKTQLNYLSFMIVLYNSRLSCFRL